MIDKQYAVLGLGRFGSSVALTLADAGCEVLAVDTDEEKVQELADHVTYAVTADATEPGVLESYSGDRDCREYGGQYPGDDHDEGGRCGLCDR